MPRCEGEQLSRAVSHWQHAAWRARGLGMELARSIRGIAGSLGGLLPASLLLVSLVQVYSRSKVLFSLQVYSGPILFTVLAGARPLRQYGFDHEAHQTERA